MTSAPAIAAAGIGYRRPHRKDLLGGDGPRPDVLEIVPEHFFSAPDELDALAAAYPMIFHAVDLSVGTVEGRGKSRATAVSQARLARVCGLARRGRRPLLVSDHLAMSRSPGGVELGHFLPIPHTEEMLAVVVDRVRAWQDTLCVPVALENIARPFALSAPMMMAEGEFFERLVDATGCGMLLDLTNLLYNARNDGVDPAAELAAYPLHAVVAVHLAGGFQRPHDGFWVDSHSHAVDREALALLRHLPVTTALRAIIIERDAHLPAFAALVAEAREAVRVLRVFWSGSLWQDGGNER